MTEDKPEANEPTPLGKGREAKGGGMFVWGILAGALITALVFYKQVLGVLKDAFTNIMPVFLTPGILEISLGVTGIAVVILVNWILLRREQQDEWVELPDDED